MNFSGRSVRLASRVMEMDEVFDVKIVSAPKCGPKALKIASLTLSFSVAASIIKSHGPRSAMVSDVLIRAIASALASAVTLPRVTWRSMLRSIVTKALLRLSSLTSFISTS